MKLEWHTNALEEDHRQSDDTKRLDWLLKFLRESTIQAVERANERLCNAKFDFNSLDRSTIDDAMKEGK